jgi:hypothetical protein
MPGVGLYEMQTRWCLPSIELLDPVSVQYFSVVYPVHQHVV